MVTAAKREAPVVDGAEDARAAREELAAALQRAGIALHALDVSAFAWHPLVDLGPCVPTVARELAAHLRNVPDDVLISPDSVLQKDGLLQRNDVLQTDDVLQRGTAQ